MDVGRVTRQSQCSSVRGGLRWDDVPLCVRPPRMRERYRLDADRRGKITGRCER